MKKKALNLSSHFPLLLTPKTILLVDDDHDDQMIFCNVVHEINEHINCVCVENAEKALSRLKDPELKPSYIFLDLNLPFMSGMECLQLLKADHQLQKIPVIIYSTSSHEKDKEQARKHGAQHYITKANSYNALRASLVPVISGF